MELCDVAFKEFKKRLISSPVLTFLKEDWSFFLTDIDASNHGNGRGSSVSNSGRKIESNSLL